MKKIFTLLAAMAATTLAWAEAPVLLFQGQPVQQGVTYETGYVIEDVIELAPGMVFTIYKQDTDLAIQGTSGAEACVQVKASDKIQICTFGGCQIESSLTKTGLLTGEPQSLEIHQSVEDFMGEDPATLMKDITVEVTAYYKSSPADKAYAKVVLTNRPASEVGGVADVAVDGAKIILRGNTLDYSVNTPTKLEIYNVNGGLVMSQKILSVGSISLDALRPGVYIYSANGVTGKILVRK